MTNNVPDKQPWFKCKRSWIMSAKKLKTKEELQDFIAALEAFADGDEYTAKTDRVDMLIDDMRDFLQYSRQCYENMQKGGRPKKGNEKSKSNTDNQQIKENPFNGLKTGQNKEKENKIENKIENERESDTEKAPGHAIDIKFVLNKYLDICTSLPKAFALTADIANNVNSALQILEETKIDGCTSIDEKLCYLFEKVQNSDYLSGRNRKFKANLDWIFKDDNIVKILNGNYDNGDGASKFAVGQMLKSSNNNYTF